MKIRDIIKIIQKDGRLLSVTRGSHMQYRHPGKPGTVTIAGHPSDEIHPKTALSILKQGGLR